MNNSKKVAAKYTVGVINNIIFVWKFTWLMHSMVNFLILITLVDAEVRPDDSFKFHYVFKGPKKDGKVKRLYYVYGTHLSAKDEGIKQEPYRPVGKGYNWPESYRKANNLYYELTFPEQGKISCPITTLPWLVTSANC